MVLLNVPDSSILCQQYLTIIYQNARMQNNHAKDNIAKTYGEILFTSINHLLSTIHLTENDIFVDLGSGLGKVVLQFFLQSAVKEACGIEIIPELHQQAMCAAKRVQQDLPEFYANGRKLTFLHGNFLETPFTTASVILIGSPCFNPRMLYSLAKIINNTPAIHAVLTLRPLSTLHHLPFKKAVRVECSWDTALCYIYTRNRAARVSKRSWKSIVKI